MSEKSQINNVRDFGAKGDGIVDDTSAIQKAIDSAIDQRYGPEETSRPCLGTVHLPSGIYRITAPLKVYSVMGFRFSGDGASTVIRPDGKMDSVLEINGAAYSEFSRFRIDGGGKAEVADVVSYEWDPKISVRSSSICRFQFIDVMNFKSFVNGFAVGRNAGIGQVDCSYFEHCSVEGGWEKGDLVNFQNAFLIGGGPHGNNLCHFLLHPILAGCRYLIAGRGSLPITVMGGSFGNAESVFLWQSSGPLTCIGGRAESCQRLYVDATNTSWDSVVSIQNFVFMGVSIADDGVIVQWNTGGRLKLDGVQFADVKRGVVPRINVVAWAATDVTIDGVYCLTDPDDFVHLLGGDPANFRLSCSGYRQLKSDGLSHLKTAPSSPDLHVARNLVVGGSITGTSLDLGDGRRWTSDGLYPGGFIKWPGSGGLGPGEDESLRYVSWSCDTDGNRRQGYVVQPMKQKHKSM